MHVRGGLLMLDCICSASLSSLYRCRCLCRWHWLCCGYISAEVPRNARRQQLQFPAAPAGYLHLQSLPPTSPQSPVPLCTTMSVHNTTREGNSNGSSSDSESTSTPTLTLTLGWCLTPVCSCALVRLVLVMLRLHCVNAFC